MHCMFGMDSRLASSDCKTECRLYGVERRDLVCGRVCGMVCWGENKDK